MSLSDSITVLRNVVAELESMETAEDALNGVKDEAANLESAADELQQAIDALPDTTLGDAEEVLKQLSQDAEALKDGLTALVRDISEKADEQSSGVRGWR